MTRVIWLLIILGEYDLLWRFVSSWNHRFSRVVCSPVRDESKHSRFKWTKGEKGGEQKSKKQCEGTPGSLDSWPHVKVSVDKTLNPKTLAPYMQLPVLKNFPKGFNKVSVLLPLINYYIALVLQAILPLSTLICFQSFRLHLIVFPSGWSCLSCHGDSSAVSCHMIRSAFVQRHLQKVCCCALGTVHYGSKSLAVKSRAKSSNLLLRPIEASPQIAPLWRWLAHQSFVVIKTVINTRLWSWLRYGTRTTSLSLV